MLRCRSVSILLQFSRRLSVAAKMEGTLQKPKLQVNVDITSDVVCPWCVVVHVSLSEDVGRCFYTLPLLSVAMQNSAMF